MITSGWKRKSPHRFFRRETRLCQAADG
jgi:hypothetical protein